MRDASKTLLVQPANNVHLLMTSYKSHLIISFARFKLIEPVVEHLSEKKLNQQRGSHFL